MQTGPRTGSLGGAGRCSRARASRMPVARATKRASAFRRDGGAFSPADVPRVAFIAAAGRQGRLITRPFRQALATGNRLRAKTGLAIFVQRSLACVRARVRVQGARVSFRRPATQCAQARARNPEVVVSQPGEGGSRDQNSDAPPACRARGPRGDVVPVPARSSWFARSGRPADWI